MWSSLFELDFWIWATGFGSQNLVGGFMEFDFGIGILEFGFAVWTWTSGSGVKEAFPRIWIWHPGCGFQYRDL